MTRWYLDTSAALKLLVEEPESAALAAHLDGRDDAVAIVSTLLLETELRRAAQRHPGLTQRAVSDLLQRVSLHAIDDAMYREAGLLAGEHLRSLDALHLIGAIRCSADAVITYDARMQHAAAALGHAVIAPGATIQP